MKKLIIEALRLMWLGLIMAVMGVGIIWMQKYWHGLSPDTKLALAGGHIILGLAAFLMAWLIGYFKDMDIFEAKVIALILCLVTGCVALLSLIGASGMDMLGNLERKSKS